MVEWTLEPGDIVTRAEVARLYGGALYGGIQPSRSTGNIFVYSDRESGEKNGYIYDGWSPDADEEAVFYYTGEGQVGHQKLTSGNSALVQHADAERSIRLFATLPTPAKGEKRHQYMGEFVLDALNPYRIEGAPDRDGNFRNVFVFRLIAVGDERLRDVAPTARYSERSSRAFREGMPTNEVGLHAPVTATAMVPDIRFVDPERHLVLQFDRPPSAGQRAMKKEATLVQSWEKHLRARGHQVERARIPVPGERELVTDTVDRTAHVLFEAKSSQDRSTVRLAIGQLIDYGRFLPDLHRSVLLPKAPSIDVGSLIHSCGFGLVFREGGSWRTENLEVYN